jgi:hypothetical protein
VEEIYNTQLREFWDWEGDIEQTCPDFSLGMEMGGGGGGAFPIRLRVVF